jgi:hypothetical protein
MAVEEVAKVISNWREADLDEQEKRCWRSQKSLR